MSFVLKTLLAAVWLVLIPSLSGVVIIRKQGKITWGESYLFGLIYMMALSEILILTMMTAELPLTALVVAFAAIMLFTAAAGIVKIIKKEWIFGETWNILKSQKLWFYIAAVLIIVQIIYGCVYAHYDADDAFYVGTATTAVHTDTIFAISPYTGYPYERPPVRYVLSPFPILLAVLSRLSGGMHPAILAHVFFSAFFIFAAYIVIFLLGTRFFPKNEEAQGKFLFYISILVLFSAYSVYNRENFEYIRIWQGKAFMAAVLIPTALYLGFSMIMKKKEIYNWGILFLTCLAACLTTTMSVAIMPVSIGIMGLIGAWQYRNFRKLLYSILSAVPCLALGIVYYIIK